MSCLKTFCTSKNWTDDFKAEVKTINIENSIMSNFQCRKVLHLFSFATMFFCKNSINFKERIQRDKISSNIFSGQFIKLNITIKPDELCCTSLAI